MNDNGCGWWDVISEKKKLVTMGTNVNGNNRKKNKAVWLLEMVTGLML